MGLQAAPVVTPKTILPGLMDRVVAGDKSAWLLLMYILFGVIIFYMFSLSRDFKGTTVALRKMFPSWSDGAIVKLDVFLVTVLGTGVAAAIFNPSTPTEAMISGVGWIGALQTITGASRIPEQLGKSDSPDTAAGKTA